MKKNPKGFTLVETVLLIAVLSIIVLVAVPSVINTLNNLKLNLAAAKLTADVRYARELALSQHKTCGVEFQPSNNLYQIFCLNNTTKVLVKDPMKRGDFIIDYDTQRELAGVTLSSTSVCAVGTCSTRELRINAFGRPMDANNNFFTSPATATISLGAASRTVSVTQETGYTEIV